MNKVKKALSFLFLPFGLLAASCSHRSATENVILGVGNAGPLKFTLVVSDPVAEKSWTSDGKLLPDFYNPELLIPEEDEAGLFPAMSHNKFLWPKTLKFFVVVQGDRKAAVPYGKIALDNPDGKDYVFQNAGFDTSDPNISKDDLAKLPEEPAIGLSEYSLPMDSRTHLALATQPCIFWCQEFQRFHPISHTIRFAYSIQPWDSVGAYQFDNGKESGTRFIKSVTPNIGSERGASRKLVMNLPMPSESTQYRLLVKDKDGQIMHDLTSEWSMDSIVGSSSYANLQGSYVNVRRSGNVETITDRNNVPSLANAASVELQSRRIQWTSFDKVAFTPTP